MKVEGPESLLFGARNGCHTMRELARTRAFFEILGAPHRKVYIFLKPRMDAMKREWECRRSTQFLRG
jgi:hypothetical protein